MEGKTCFTLRADEKFFENLAAYTKKTGCKSQNEFLQRAVRFYCGYIDGNDDQDYLAASVTSVIKGVLDAQANRTSSVEFRMAVELCKLSHIIASVCELTGDDMNRLHQNCVEEINDNGRFPDLRNSVEYFRTYGGAWKQPE